MLTKFAKSLVGAIALCGGHFLMNFVILVSLFHTLELMN